MNKKSISALLFLLLAAGASFGVPTPAEVAYRYFMKATSKPTISKRFSQNNLQSCHEIHGLAKRSSGDGLSCRRCTLFT